MKLDHNTLCEFSGLLIFVFLTVVFAVLKLAGVIHWSWWWVFCPIWLPIVVVIILFCWADQQAK